MSLLLDALQRASKEKEKLADARASADKASTDTAPAPREAFPPLSIDFESDALPAADPIASSDANSPGLAPEPPPLSTAAPVELTLRPMEEMPAETASVAGDASLTQAAPDTPAESVPLEPEMSSGRNLEYVPESPGLRKEPSVSPDVPAGEAKPAGRAAMAHPSPVVSPQVAREILGATAKPAQRGPNRRLIALGVLALLIAAANAAFFLGFLDRFLGISPSGLTPSGPPPTVVAAAPPATAPAPADPAAAPVPDPVAAEGQPAGGSPGASEVKPEIPAATSTSAALRASRAAPRAAPRAAMRRDKASMPGEETSATKPASRTPGARSKPVFVAKPAALSALDTAYAALTDDRLDEAGIAYRKALEKNPGERDALLGLAYIAQRQGNSDEARIHYQNVLRQEPANASANAGLLAIAAEGDLAGAASRAREMAERAPDSAAVLSAFAGILAREGRIAEAQQVYFKALTLEPDNALHAYNLAVALDRLHKYAQARSYYQRALALAEKSNAGDRANFPRSEALQRLDQLSATGSGAQVGYIPESRAR
jgi:tetratricopeptide (TPR) repeat protein